MEEVAESIHLSQEAPVRMRWIKGRCDGQSLLRQSKKRSRHPVRDGNGRGSVDVRCLECHGREGVAALGLGEQLGVGHGLAVGSKLIQRSLELRSPAEDEQCHQEIFHTLKSQANWKSTDVQSILQANCRLREVWETASCVW